MQDSLALAVGSHWGPVTGTITAYTPLFRDNFAGRTLQGIDYSLGRLTQAFWDGPARGLFSNQVPFGRELEDAKMGVLLFAMPLSRLRAGAARGVVRAIDAPIKATQAGERFVRVGASPENLRMTFSGPGGTRAGTHAFPEATFNQLGRDPAALKNFGDLPGAPPQYFRIFEPPAGTPIQRGIVPGGEYGGVGGVPEVYFPNGF